MKRRHLFEAQLLYLQPFEYLAAIMAESIDIQQINQMRISMGMKPLPVPGGDGPQFKGKTSKESEEEEEVGSTLESRQEEGYENYRRIKEAEKKKADRDVRNAEIKKQREAAQRQTKLDGKGLGDADGDDMDTKSWLIKQKKRQKEIEKARKREQELAEEEAARQAEYTAKDLAGVKVGHELDSFAEGEEQVLTLKDTTIDENEEDGDELENMDLRDRERLNEQLELKKRKPVYNPHDVDESGETKILSQYDDEIEGKKRSRFTLDGQGSTAEQREAAANGVLQRSKPKAISLDFLKDDEPANDYLDLKDVKVKKPKKKKAKSTRQKVVDDDDIPLSAPADDDDAMEIDQQVGAPKKRSFEDMSFVDDDDLQSSLARQRRDALKKRKRVRPEDIARQLREEGSATPGPDAEYDASAGGLVIDETSEFVANLQKPKAQDSNRARSMSRPAEAVTDMNADSDTEDGDVDMSTTYANIEDDEDLKARILRQAEEASAPATGIEDEATIETGVGSALKLLKERGILKTAESGDPNAIFRQQQQFLAERHRREAQAEQKARDQRERDRLSGRLDRMSAKEREEYARQQNNYRDQQESRMLAEHFNREYKPNVELKYIDDHGRSLNQKEAFKQMSHQFHGKGSGKQKTEKLLKKIEDEKRRESQSLLDSSGGGMSGAAAQQIKKNRQAGVRLA